MFINVFLIHGQLKNDYANYYINLNKAECSENIDSSIYYYKRAFDLVKKPNPIDVYNLASFLIQKNLKQDGLKWLKKSILLGLKFKSDSTLLEQDKILPIEYGIITLGPNSNEIKNYIDKHYEKLRKKYLKKCITNDPIFGLLQNEIQFQTIRMPIYDSLHNQKYQYFNSFGYSVNSYLIWKMVKENKMPFRHNSAYLNNHSLSMLLFHSLSGFLNDKDVKAFLEDLKKTIFTGLITPDEYATVYDFYFFSFIDQEKTFYGTQVYFDTLTNRTRVQKLFNNLEINDLRRSIWLYNFDCYLFNMDYLKPINYE